MPEHNYKILIDEYLDQMTSVEAFIDAYFRLWKSERDNGTLEGYDPRFQRMVDRIFTSCDCYRKDPQQPHEISEAELRNELDVLRHIWWG